MKLCTTSETISFSKDLEERSSNFYKRLEEIHPEEKRFTAFVEENRKFVIQIQRAYQSVITDAIEGCFAFQLESDEYELDTAPPDRPGLGEAVRKALAMEEVIVRFYETAADQSMSLMADIPRNFKLVVKKRKARMESLKTLL
jgi:hypothetical protein